MAEDAAFVLAVARASGLRGKAASAVAADVWAVWAGIRRASMPALGGGAARLAEVLRRVPEAEGRCAALAVGPRGDEGEGAALCVATAGHTFAESVERCEWPVLVDADGALERPRVLEGQARADTLRRLEEAGRAAARAAREGRAGVSTGEGLPLATLAGWLLEYPSVYCWSGGAGGSDDNCLGMHPCVLRSVRLPGRAHPLVAYSVPEGVDGLGAAVAEAEARTLAAFERRCGTRPEASATPFCIPRVML